MAKNMEKTTSSLGTWNVHWFLWYHLGMIHPMLQRSDVLRSSNTGNRRKPPHFSWKTRCFPADVPFKSSQWCLGFIQTMDFINNHWRNIVQPTKLRLSCLVPAVQLRKKKHQITWDVFFSNHPPEFIGLPLIGHSYWKTYICYVQLAVNSGIK